MPWSCPTCAIEVLDTLPTCPSCGAAKSAWTLVADRTRQMVLGKRARVEVLRGTGRAPTQPDAPPGPLVPAERCYVVPVAAAEAWSEAGQLPAPRDVLTVRLHPTAQSDLTLSLLLDFEGREMDEQEHPQTLPEGAEYVDARFVFVFGEGDPPSFPGLTVIDLSDETDDGFAPGIEVEALRRPSVELPTAGALPAVAPDEIRFLIVDDEGNPASAGAWDLGSLGAGALEEGEGGVGGASAEAQLTLSDLRFGATP